MIVYIALQLALCLLVAVSFFRGTPAFLWAVAFLVPLNGLGVLVGVNLNWPKLVAFLLLLYSVAINRIPRIQRLPGGRETLLLALYAALLSAFAWLVDSEARDALRTAKQIGWGAGQTDLRYLVQYFAFAQTWLVPFLIMNMVQTKAAMESVHRGFLAGTVASTAAGIYQVFAIPFGLPWFSLELAELVQGHLGLREEVQMFSLGGISLARLYGLSGEPKHTASFAVLALTLILASKVGQTGQRLRPGAPVLLLVALGLTFSTSGWASAAGVTAYFLIYALSRGEWRLARTLGSVLAVLGVVVVMASSKDLDAIFEDRISSRLESADSALTHEYKDAALLDHLKDSPLRTFFGHGPGGVDFFLIPYVPSSALSPDSTITPTYTTTRILSDVGLVGLLIAGFILTGWRRRLKPVEEAHGGYLYLGAGAIGLLLMPYVALQAYFVTAAAVVGYVRTVSTPQAAISKPETRA